MGNELCKSQRLVCAVGYLDRMKGFLVKRPKGCVLLIAPCRSIHTFGMRFSLDVAFLSSAGTVLFAEEGVRPGRMLRCRGACAVLERASDESGKGNWYREGEETAICIGK